GANDSVVFSPTALRPYTSTGATSILFDASGNRLASPQTREPLDVCAPDGVSTTVPSFTTFAGTSAAVPHAAAVAAMIRHKFPASSPAHVQNPIRPSALSGTTTPAWMEASVTWMEADQILAAAASSVNGTTLAVTGTGQTDSLAFSSSGGTLSMTYDGARAIS